MALEDLTGAAKFLDDLVKTNPVGTDLIDDADGHLRGIKNVLLNTFPNLTGAMNATQAQLNLLTAFSSLRGYSTKSAAYTQVAADQLTLINFDTSAGAVTFTLLPAATAGAGFIQHVFLGTAGNDLTIDGDGSETINGATTKVLNTANQGVTLHCDGSGWRVINEVFPQDVVRLTGAQTIAGAKTFSNAATFNAATAIAAALTLTGAVTVNKSVSVPDHTDESTSGAITFDFTDGNILEATLDENITSITLSGMVANGVYEIWITQDATTARTVSGWTGVDKWVAGSAPTMNTGLGEMMVVILRKNSAKVQGSVENAG